MTNESIVSEIQKNHNRKENLELLYRQNRGLVIKAADRFKSLAEFDDLSQEAYIALQEAADRYDPAAGASFASFAYQHIYYSLHNYLRDNQHSVHIPAHLRNKVLKYKRICEVYAKTTGEAVTIQSAAQLLGVSRDQAELIALAANHLQTRSLDEPLADDEGFTLEDTIQDPADRIGELIDDLADQKVNAGMWKCVDSLGSRPSKILRRRYQQNETMKSIADSLGCSSQRVSQEHAAALRKLRRLREIKRALDHYNFRKSSTGLSRFRQTWTSQPEAFVIWREKLLESCNAVLSGQSSECHPEPPNRQIME